ncbi:uncharacterized protein LOC144452818 isoform X2 [Glandiceps talaboti]
MLLHFMFPILTAAILYSFLSSVDGAQFDYYKSYPGYEDHCIGGDLETKTFVFNGGTSQVKTSITTDLLLEFSFCWWMKTDDPNNQGTLVEYFASAKNNIKVENPQSLQSTVNGEKGDPSGIETNYGEWHHVCVTWTPSVPTSDDPSTTEGVLKYYKAGYMLLEQIGLASNQKIGGPGDLKLGEGYKGEMTQFNMWSTCLTVDGVLALSEDSLNPGCGDLLWWSSIKSSDLSNVKTKETDLFVAPQYPKFCMDEDAKDETWGFVNDDDHVRLDYTLPELGEFTICFWIKATDTTNPDQTILSYFAKGDTIGSIVLGDLGNLQMVIHNQEAKTSKLDFLDGQWHHVCVTWDSATGQHKYYKDGEVTGKKDLAQHMMVRTGGDLVIGQKQTEVGGGFENGLRAKLALFNMWKKRLAKDSIDVMANDRCERACGDLIWWPHLTDDLSKDNTVDSGTEIAVDLGPCAYRHYCDPGVLDEYLWKINNMGDWSLAPLPKKIPDLSEFTICYWMFLDEEYGDNSNVAFSYFVQGDTEGSIVVENVNDLVVIINNKKSDFTGINLNNLTSHVICLTWSSQNGDLTIYDRKEELYTESGLASGESIKGGGYLVIGQKQSIPGGGFNKEDAFNGRLRYFNFYSTVLNKKGIKMASRVCTPDCGDVVSWRELTHADLINIKLFNFTCGGSGDETTIAPTTTAAPTTTIPTTTTAAPTTPKPTTVAPTTPKPTTVAPTTNKTTTAAPTTPKPTTVAPTTNKTTTAAPTTPKPTTVAPTTNKTTTAAPTTPKPTTVPPTTNKTTVAPTTPKPTTVPPTTNKTTAAPTTPKPTTVPPTTNKTTVAPTTPKPTTVPPTTNKTTAAPTTPKPTTAAPTTPKPLTNATTKPATAMPTTKSTTKVPTTSKPTTQLPTTATQPTTKPPTTKIPTTNQPTTTPVVTTTKLPPTTKKPTTIPPVITTRGPKTPPPQCLPEKPSSGTPCPDVNEKAICKDEVPSCLKNIALGKCTEQSSSYWYTQSNSATDGAKITSFCYGSCTFTREEFEPWWRVDLGKSRVVNYVTLTNAQDCLDEEHLLGAEVRVGNFKDFRKNNLCGVVTNEVAKSGIINLDCQNGPLAGRYVTVQIRCRNGILCLCEVQVWSDDTDHLIDKDVDEQYTGCRLEVGPKQSEPEETNQKQGFSPAGGGFIGGYIAPFQQYIFNMCCASNSKS